MRHARGTAGVYLSSVLRDAARLERPYFLRRLARIRGSGSRLLEVRCSASRAAGSGAGRDETPGLGGDAAGRGCWRRRRTDAR